ncbi:ureidoglycolate dehydrogenase, partial [Escherichia coli]|nr:ureidoglycolate dehydrogenase [Escherichia coli]EGD5140348.1 ureidoglycolate dehydrogenase [Escherichia coli]EIA9093569.1 Ldh family oxidoreductase [Escherichia coli]
IVINPNFFSSSELFRQHLSQTMRELNTMTPAPGFNQVYYPGQDQDIKQRKAAVEGIEIVDDIYQYLISDALYNTSYETKNPFAQ